MQQLYQPRAITMQLSDSSGTISDVRLTLKREGEVNVLSIAFFYQLEMNWRSVDFLLRPLSTTSTILLQALHCKKATEKIFTVIDLYPLNGTVRSKFDIKDFIRPTHRNEIKQHMGILDEIDCKNEYTRCVVIDFKDKNKRYDCLEEILGAENDFATFFRGDGSNKKNIQADIYNLFKKCRVNFLINEGSLKANLLKKVFRPEQSNFFQDNEKGSQLLCQLCEVIMNGFKQGRGFVVNECKFNPNDYVCFINGFDEKNEDENFESRMLLPTRLITLYPYVYKTTYSIESIYYQLITNIFRTTHEHKNETTIITIEQ